MKSIDKMRLKFVRSELRRLHDVRDDLHREIDILTEEYLRMDCTKLYVTNHAILRYAQRVLGLETFGDTEFEQVSNLPISPERIRVNMLTKDEEVTILKNNITLFDKGGYVLLIKGLSVVTVMLKD